MHNIIKLLTNTKYAYKCIRDDKYKPINNIANYGAKTGTKITVGRNGEYSDFIVEIQEDYPHILSDYHIQEAITSISKNDTDKVLYYLNLRNDYIKYGERVVTYVLKTWLLNNINNLSSSDYIEIENLYNIQNDENQLKNDTKLNKYISLNRHDPINCRIKVVSSGSSTKGNPVVPESWIGKIFNNCEELHRTMDKLDWRKGKPPITYCCTHGMVIVKDNRLELCDGDIEIDKNKIDYIIKIELEKNLLRSTIIDDFDSKITPKINTEMLTYQNLCFLVDRNIFKSKTETKYVKIHNVGVLSSRLQKCIRRGSSCSKTLINTIEQLNASPQYNLPDQKFIRVSGSRQLLWRSFISIIEDSEGYINELYDVNKIIDLLDFYVLSLLCTIDPDLQLSTESIKIIKQTLLMVQNNPSSWDYHSSEYYSDININNIARLTPICDNNTRVIDSMILAIGYSNMMSNDRNMLIRYIDYIGNTPYKCQTITEKMVRDINNYTELSSKEIEKIAYIRSYDMHCVPNILLKIQAYIPFIQNRENYTTQQLSKFIWENFSKENYRKKSTNMIKNICKDSVENIKSMIKTIDIVQKTYLNVNNTLAENKSKDLIERVVITSNNVINTINQNNKYDNLQFVDRTIVSINDNKIDKNISRQGFLLIFGKTIRYNKYDVIIAGTDKEIVKFKQGSKYIDSTDKNRNKLEIEFIKQFNKQIKMPAPPEKTKWIGFSVNETVELTSKIVNDKIIFCINKVEIEPFDCNKILTYINDVKPLALDNGIILDALMKALYIINDLNFNVVTDMKIITQTRILHNDYTVYDWIDYISLSSNINILKEIFRQFYSKLVMNIAVKKADNYNSKEYNVLIGPVDRMGNKTHNSISYKYEGVFIRILYVLGMLYPQCIHSTSNDCIFKVNVSGIGYKHMIKSLNDLIKSSDELITREPKVIKLPITEIKNKVIIKTTLWDHQLITVNKMFDGIINNKRKGFGDASHVGAGKTLTALSLMAKIANYNVTTNPILVSRGFLVLLPTDKLYKTWSDEIMKHTKGFDIVYQTNDGKITNSSNLKFTNNYESVFSYNTILITTLGRMRDHPIFIPWDLVIIDECLSVQNKDALQTEEAFRQVLLSNYGVVMMSATFFRSRFDKMFYMLKMLQSGLPETPEYLDTILSETMICNIGENNRIWTTTTTKYQLKDSDRKMYENIKFNNINKGFDMIYSLLSSYIISKCDYINYFNKRILEITNNKLNNKRILIYARSKEEADKIAENIDGVTRYPDKTGKHVVVSYAEGTYGLNDLIEYNTILTRIPDPDKIQQMKGRLDRYGQKSNNLYMEYILLENTIEEGQLYKLEVSRNFYNNHIVPLADFYKCALGM